MKKFAFALLAFIFCACNNPDVVTEFKIENPDTLFIEVPDMYSGFVITEIKDFDSNGDSIPDVTVARIKNKECQREIWMCVDIGQFYNVGDTLGKEYENYE